MSDKEEVALAELQQKQGKLVSIEDDGSLSHKFSHVEGLSGDQRTILRFHQLGFSQVEIAKVMGISQPRVSQQVSKIKEAIKASGTDVDGALVVGYARSQYSNLIKETWALHRSTKDEAIKLKTLETVAKFMEKEQRLLMDVGLLAKAEHNTTVTVQMSPLIQRWDKGDREAVAGEIVNRQLSALPAPKPPEVLDVEGQEEGMEDAYE